MQAMKAITLWQPWASFIVAGIKHYETRSWKPSYFHGELAIHASKKQTAELRRYFYAIQMEFPVSLKLSKRFEDLPFGCVVAICKVVRYHRAEEIRKLLSGHELAIGDYTDGRYAWELTLVKVFDTPIPVKGAQGLWTWQYNSL